MRIQEYSMHSNDRKKKVEEMKYRRKTNSQPHAEYK